VSNFFGGGYSWSCWCRCRLVLNGPRSLIMGYWSKSWAWLDDSELKPSSQYVPSNRDAWSIISPFQSFGFLPRQTDILELCKAVVRTGCDQGWRVS
jgi:hypothetical protein